MYHVLLQGFTCLVSYALPLSNLALEWEWLSATLNVLIRDDTCALCCSWFIPKRLEVQSLLWSYSRSPGRFPSGRSHYPRRHVQVQAEHAKSLT